MGFLFKKQWAHTKQLKTKNYFLRIKNDFLNNQIKKIKKLRNHQNNINYKRQKRQIYKKKLYVNLKRLWVKGSRYIKFRIKRNPILGFKKPKKRPHVSQFLALTAEYELEYSILNNLEVFASSETDNEY